MLELAKISANGQITVPINIRKSLGLKEGDKDFMEVQIDFPEICTPRDFILKYLS